MEKLQIKITDEIGGWGFGFSDLTDQLAGFNGEEIKVPINSYGGSVLDGIAIYNTLLGRKENVETHIIGYAMSMGTVIACSGDVCSMPENGYYMIHNPLKLAIGDHREMEHSAKILSMMKEDIAQIYKRKTGLSLTKIKSMMDAETWLSAKEAKKLGFVDTLTKGAQFEASYKPVDFDKYVNIPEGLFTNEISKEEKNNKMNWREKFNAFTNKVFKTDEEAVAFMDNSNLTKVIDESVNAKFDAIKNDAPEIEAVSKEDFEALKEEMTANKSAIAEVAKLSTEIETVKSDLNNAVSELKEFKDGKEIFENKVAELEETNAGLVEEVKNVKEDHENLKTENGKLVKEASDLKAVVNKKPEATQTSDVINAGTKTVASDAFAKAFQDLQDGVKEGK